MNTLLNYVSFLLWPPFYPSCWSIAYENLRRNYTEKNWDKLKKINQLYVLFYLDMYGNIRILAIDK